MFRVWVAAMVVLSIGGVAMAQLSSIDKALAGHWLGYPEDGETVQDATSNANHGTISAGSGGRSDKGPFRTAFAFNDSFVECGPAESLTANPKYTYTAWILPNGWGKANEGRIISVGLQNSFSIKDKNQSLFFRRHHKDTNGLWRSDQGSIQLGKWQFVAVTYDSGAGNAPSFYIDGVQSPTTVEQEPVGEVMAQTDMPFSIGSDTGNTRNFDGLISNVRVYNRVLSPAEIERLADEPNYRLVFAD